MSAQLRLFVGVELPASIKEALGAVRDDLAMQMRAHDVVANWTRTENFHITLKFIGACDAARVPKIEQALARVRALPLRLALQGVGQFPAVGKPKVFWIGVREEAALTALAEEVDVALSEVGFARETRPYVAHVTLARVKHVRGVIDGASLGSSSPGEAIACDLSEIALFESTTTPAGPKYQVISRTPLSS